MEVLEYPEKAIAMLTNSFETSVASPKYKDQSQDESQKVYLLYNNHPTEAVRELCGTVAEQLVNTSSSS